MEIWQYYRILRKRKWLIIIGTLICVGIVGTATYLAPQKWEAYATMMEQVPGSYNIDIFYSPILQLDPQLSLRNLSQLLMSQTVMQRSAETLWRLGISASPQDILSTLAVRPVGDTMILGIYLRSDSQDEAKATADVVAAEFIKFYNELNYGGAARSREFIKNELPKAEARLNGIQDELRKFKEESGAVMLPRQTDFLLQQLSQFETSLSQYAVQAQQANAKLDSLEDQMKAFPETRTAATVVSANPVWQTLQVELVRLEIELQKMLKDRKPGHPEVQALEQQIAEAKSKLTEAGKEILSSTTETVNPIRDNVVQNYISALVEYSSAAAAESAASQVIGSLQPELQSLPAKEMRLAQLTVDEEAAKNTYSLLRGKLDEATIKEKEAENVSSIQIVDSARTRPADMKKGLKLVLAILLSPIFCSGIALLLNYLDNSVRTPAEAEELLKLPVFAVVPMAKAHSLVDGQHLAAIGTSYQMLSTNLFIGNTEMEGRTVLVASAEPDVGRSTTAANLAITLARDGARVILVDSDLRQPAQHIIFGIENDKGFSNVLAGQLSLKDALKPTSVTDLLLIPSGPLPANPVRLFRSEELSKFVNAVNGLADFVVFDSPAGITFADSALLAAVVRNVIIIHAAGTVPRGAEAEFRNRLENVNANLLGAVLNMVNPEDSHGFYHFRSAYEELMKDGRGPAALPGRVVGPISGKSDEDLKKSGGTES